MRQREHSALTRQHEREFIGLCLSADPGSEGLHDLLRDRVEREMAMAADDFDHALFTELAEFVFGLGDTVAVGDENVAGLELLGSLLVTHIVDEANDGASAVEAGDGVVSTQEERR